jgi:hypothetical protein
MKKALAVMMLWLGLTIGAKAQTLLYQWQFTNATDTASNSTPTYAVTPGTGMLGLDTLADPDPVAAGQIFYANTGYGPPGGPGGALVFNGQSENGVPAGVGDACGTNSTLNLGSLYQFTMTFWVQYGTTVDSSSQLARGVEFGQILGYDSGGKGSGNFNGVGTAIDINGSDYEPQVGIANASGGENNPEDNFAWPSPFFDTGFLCDGETWYFESVVYDGTVSANNFTIWLYATNATTVTGTTALSNIVENANYGPINFGTTASVLLGGCTGASRGISTGQIGDVRLYEGIMSSNNLWLIAHFQPPVLSTQNPTAPTVTVQPVSGTNFVGGSRTFTVSANGYPTTFTYQWQSNGVPISGATNASYTVNNVQPIANGAQFVCGVTNGINPGVSSQAGVLTVVSTSAEGAYAQLAYSLNPYSLWILNSASNTIETITGPPGDLVTNYTSEVLSDYANGHDAIAVDPENMTWTNNILEPPTFPGFLANNVNVGVVEAYDVPSRLNTPPLPVLTNNAMTICGWVYTPTTGVSGNGLMSDLPSDTSNPFGMYFGANNELDYQWGNGAASETSGLLIPQSEWSFVALVVSTNVSLYGWEAPLTSDTNAVLYVGSPSVGLNSVYYSTATTGDIITSGTSLATFALGRSTISASENGGFYAGSTVDFSDVAVFYSALSPQTITNLYIAGANYSANLGLTETPDPNTPGNILLNWSTTYVPLDVYVLQSATSLTGPWIDVAGDPQPPVSIPMSSKALYYRVRE